MMKKNAIRASGKGSKIAGGMRSTFKATKSKDLQLHHLPPDILRGIMSRLTLKEAMRMSILSRKWRRLCKCYPKLVFTRATMHNNNAIVDHRKPMQLRFIRGVNSVMRQLRPANLDKFVIKFSLRKRHTLHINRWVKFSAASRAKHFVLDLCPGQKVSKDTDDRYSFPLDIFNAKGCSCVKHLRLGFVLLTLLSNCCGFKNLKKLSLHRVSITGELQGFLPECPVLEWLSITWCKLVGLTINQQLGRLLFLRVEYCNLQKLNIQAPNLVKLEYSDDIIPIVLGESLKILEAKIQLFSSLDCFDYVFSELFKALSHAQSLSITFSIETEVQGFVKNPSGLIYLRHVVLKIDISGWSETSAGILRLAYLLELAPVLEELVLHMCCFGPASYVWEPSEGGFQLCPHSHLKTVCMTGFYGFHGQLELALYILRNATCLEHLIIDPVVRDNSFVLESRQRDIVRGRQLAMDHLLLKGFDKVLRIL